LDSAPFEWWKQQMDDNRLGQLHQLVGKFLVIPATSAESERYSLLLDNQLRLYELGLTQKLLGV